MASASWNRRNYAAKALGYKNYYDYRVHDNGRLPPAAPVTGQLRRRNRGHRSAADFERRLRSTRNPVRQVLPVGLERGPGGRYERILVAVLLDDGSQVDYILRGKQASEVNLRRLRRVLDDAGIHYQEAPSIDVFSSLSKAA